MLGLRPTEQEQLSPFVVRVVDQNVELDALVLHRGNGIVNGDRRHIGLRVHLDVNRGTRGPALAIRDHVGERVGPREVGIGV